MTEKITCEVSANYNKHDPPVDDVEVNWMSDQPDVVWFNITLSAKPDDYLTVSFKISDLLHAIGKVIGKDE